MTGFSGDILRGHTETVILKILMCGDSYGYEIVKTVVTESEGLFDIKDATIYTAFRRMEKDGLVEAYWKDGNTEGMRRRYYKITDRGKNVYKIKLDDWIKIKNALDKLIVIK